MLAGFIDPACDWKSDVPRQYTNTPSARMYCIEHIVYMLLCPQGSVVYTNITKARRYTVQKAFGAEQVRICNTKISA